MIAHRAVWGLLSCGVLLSSCGGGPAAEQAPFISDVLRGHCRLPAGTALPGLTDSPEGPALLFTREHGDSTSLHWARWAEGAWTDTVFIAGGTDILVNWADRPALAFGPDGQAHAHWLEIDPRGDFTYGIRTVHSMDGGQLWSVPDRPHRDTAVAEHGFGQWMVDGQGTAFGWLDGRRFDGHPDPAKAPMEVRAAQWRPESGWSAEVVLDSSACTCCPLAAAPWAGGHLLAYRDRTTEEVRDFSGIVVRAAPNGIPESTDGPLPIGSDGWRIAGCPVNGASLSASEERLLAVWFTAAGDSARVRSAWLTPEGRWSPPEDLHGGSAVGRVTAARDGLGRFHAVWMERRGDAAILVGRSWDAAGRSLQPSPVALTGVDAARAGGFPSMVGLEQGGVLLAWTETGKETHVRTALWAPSP